MKSFKCDLPLKVKRESDKNRLIDQLIMRSQGNNAGLKYSRHHNLIIIAH